MSEERRVQSLGDGKGTRLSRARLQAGRERTRTEGWMGSVIILAANIYWALTVGQALFSHGSTSVSSCNLHYYPHSTDTNSDGTCLGWRSGIQTQVSGSKVYPTNIFSTLILSTIMCEGLRAFFPSKQTTETKQLQVNWIKETIQMTWEFLHVRNGVCKVLITLNREDCSSSTRASAGLEAMGGRRVSEYTCAGGRSTISHPCPPASHSAPWQVQGS